MTEAIRRAFLLLPKEMSEYMIVNSISPHTPKVAHLSSSTKGPETSAYYFLAKCFDTVSSEESVKILKEIKKLQCNDKENRHYGCLRWYREESEIFDTNGAFFVLLPIALSYVFFSEKMSSEERQIIEEMLSVSAEWFRGECRGPLYYTNKIVSDGAILTLISEITGKYRGECLDFWNSWVEYAETYGFGWGENLSDTYAVIILRALIIASAFIDDAELSERIKSKTSELLDYLSFHEGCEFVPTVRTYNFSGDISYGGEFYKTVFNPECLDSFAALVTSYVINRLADTVALRKNTDKEDVRIQRVFGDSYAYTYKSPRVRLGSLSRFPVMPGCYQREGWGLGWQSMPVSAMIRDRYISFLRLRTETRESTHSHPAKDKHSAYLYNRLFEDGEIPSYNTATAQEGNIVIAVRTVSHIANTARLFVDEWCTPGECEVECLKLDGRTWYIIDGSVALCPLCGIYSKSKKREEPTTQIMKERGFTTVSTVISRSEEDVLIRADYTECAWVIAVSENGRTDIEKIEIIDTEIADKKVPRNEKTMPRKITVRNGEKELSLTYDPYDFV